MKLSKKIELLDLQLKRDLGQDFFGLHKSIFYGTGIDFAEHREYTSGDSIKHIDWKASAKSGKIFTKKFEEERDLKVLFLLDTGSSMYFGSGERTKMDILEELFYALGVSAYSSGDSIGAYIFGGEKTKFFPVNKKKNTIFDILSSLSLNDGEKQESTFGSTLQELQRTKIQGHLIVVISDNQEIDTYKKEIAMLSQTNELIFVNLVDTFEEHLFETPGSVSFLNQGVFSQIFLGNKKKIEAYRRLREYETQKKKKFFSSIGARYTLIETQDDVFKKLLKI